MASIADYVLDAALAKLDLEANAIHVTSAEATTYLDATATLSLGSSSTVSVGAPQDRVGSAETGLGGREVLVAAITDGTVTGTGTAAFYAIVDTVNSRLLVTGALVESQPVTSGNSFTLASFAVGIPDPA